MPRTLAALIAMMAVSAATSGPASGHEGQPTLFVASPDAIGTGATSAPSAPGQQGPDRTRESAATVGGPEAFRYQLIGFVADVHTVAEEARAARPANQDVFESPPTTGAASSDSAEVAELTRGIAGLSTAEIEYLESVLGPLVRTWSATQPYAPSPAGAQRYGPAAYAPQEVDDLEELRGRLLAYYDRFDPLTAYGEQVSPAYEETLDHSRDTVSNMTLSDLDQLSQAFAQIPAWQTLVDIDPDVVIEPHALADIDSKTPGSASAAVPLTHLHPQCADAAFGPIVTQVLNYLANTAEDLTDIWSNDFFIAAAGFGSNAPNIPKIITLLIYYPLKAVAIAASFDSSIAMNCNEGYHQTLMADHDAAMLERTNVISSTITAHDLDMKTRLDRVDTFQARFRETAIRLALEKDLLRKGDSRISLFQIPGSLCITTGEHEVCGMLETARDVADDTIRIGQELGLDMTEAEASFDDGVSHHGLGEYKEAYTRYREAYVLAVRAEP